MTPNTTSIFVTMLDSWGDGWSGNTIALKQDNVVVATFGTGFTTGHQYGPVEIVIKRGILTSIVVGVFGSWRNEIGFAIRDKNGVQLFSRVPGVSYTADTIFGTICATCLNYSPVR